MEVLKNILKENKNISEISCRENYVYCKTLYKLCADCILSTKLGKVSVLIGVPENWDLNLFDIYIKDKNFAFIPHMETDGKLCLFDTEGVLIDRNFGGLLNQCIDRACDIIDSGLSGKNIEEFVDEYNSYWLGFENNIQASIYVPNTNTTQEIKCAVETVKKGNEQSFISYKNKQKYAKIVISSDPNDFKCLEYTYTLVNCIYVYLSVSEYIIPPDPRKKFSVEYVNNLLSLLDEENEQKLLLSYKNHKYLFFEIVQPNGAKNIIGVYFNRCTIKKTDTGKLMVLEHEVCVPVCLKNISKIHLLNRTKTSEQSKIKKVLLLGCGSVGSYILNELAKSGFENITVVDNDLLLEENIFRHFLGTEYVREYKTVAMSKYLNKNIPNMNIITVEETIEEALNDNSIDFSNYDYIISAIGNHNVNRWINRFVFENHISVPVIYAWNEILGIGNHVALIKYGYSGCYECFFDRDEDGLMYDKTSYCEKNQKIAKKLIGCGSYIPYGSSVSLKTACMCVDVLNREIDSSSTCNFIKSSKGDNLYFIKEGLSVSHKYNNQISETVVCSGSEFLKTNCEVCENDN